MRLFDGRLCGCSESRDVDGAPADGADEVNRGMANAVPKMLSDGPTIALPPDHSVVLPAPGGHVFRPSGLSELYLNVQQRRAWGCDEENEEEAQQQHPAAVVAASASAKSVSLSTQSVALHQSVLKPSRFASAFSIFRSSKSAADNATPALPPKGHIRGRPGFTAEASLQTAALYFGTYVSQERVRIACDACRTEEYDEAVRLQRPSPIVPRDEGEPYPPMRLGDDTLRVARWLRLTASVLFRELPETDDADDESDEAPAVHEDISSSVSGEVDPEVLAPKPETPPPTLPCVEGLQWIRRHLDAAHIVLCGFYMKLPRPLPPFTVHDKIFPVVGYAEHPTFNRAGTLRAAVSSKSKTAGANNSNAKPSEATHQTPSREMSDKDLPLLGLVVHTLDGTPGSERHLSGAQYLAVVRSNFVNIDIPVTVPDLQQYGLPKNYFHGVAITGIVDNNSECVRMMLQLDKTAEPDCSATLRNSILEVKAVCISATLMGLKPGNPYAVLRFDNPRNVPESRILSGRWDQRFTFVAPAAETQLVRFDRIPSLSVAVYRCVPLPLNVRGV